MNDRQKVEWVENKRFERDGICVVVNKLPLHRPKFSVAVGRLMEKGVSKFLPIFSHGRGSVEIDRVSEIVIHLLREAEEYIQSELQYLEDCNISNNQFYENKEMNKDKPRARVGLSGGPNSGKTARKRENKRKRMVDAKVQT